LCRKFSAVANSGLCPFGPIALKSASKSAPLAPSKHRQSLASLKCILIAFAKAKNCNAPLALIANQSHDQFNRRNIIMCEKIYAEADLFSILSYGETEVECWTLQEAKIAWNGLTKSEKEIATITSNGITYGPNEIDRLYKK
jgi:hypothetical protein